MYMEIKKKQIHTKSPGTTLPSNVIYFVNCLGPHWNLYKLHCFFCMVMKEFHYRAFVYTIKALACSVCRLEEMENNELCICCIKKWLRDFEFWYWGVMNFVGRGSFGCLWGEYDPTIHLLETELKLLFQK